MKAEPGSTSPAVAVLPPPSPLAEVLIQPIQAGLALIGHVRKKQMAWIVSRDRIKPLADSIDVAIQVYLPMLNASPQMACLIGVGLSASPIVMGCMAEESKLEPMPGEMVQ